MRIKIINNPSEIKLSDKWTPATKFNSQGNIIDVKNGRFQIIQKFQRSFSTGEKVMRVFLGLLAITCSFGLALALFPKPILGLFRKNYSAIRFALPAPASPNPNNGNSNNAPIIPPNTPSTFTVTEEQVKASEIEKILLKEPVFLKDVLTPLALQIRDQIETDLSFDSQKFSQSISSYISFADAQPLIDLTLLFLEKNENTKVERLLEALKNIDLPEVDEEKNQVITSFLKSMDKSPEIALTPHQILLDGAHDIWKTTVTPIIKIIIDAIEDDLTFNAVWLSRDFLSYTSYINAQPLITLAKHFIERNENKRAERVVDALKELINSRPYNITEKLVIVNTFLQSLEKSPKTT